MGNTRRRLGWLLGLSCLLPFAGGCTAKYKKALEQRDREIRSLREERDGIRAELDEAKAKEKLYQQQLTAVRSGTALPAEAVAPAGGGVEEKAQTIAGELQGSGVETGVRDGRVVLTLPEAITFASGKAALSDRGKKTLRQVSDTLRRQSHGRIWVEGHTDNEPIKRSPFKSNRHLSVERANAVTEFLHRECGLPEDRIVIAGFGEFSPIADNGSASGRSRNRRVEIVIE
jgi:chemotaxis protein MotB